MRKFTRIAGLAVAFAALAFALNKAQERALDAGRMFEEIMNASDGGIPGDLFAKAHCVVLVPNLTKGGFIVGAKYGRGVITCRGPEGKGWTAPATMRIEGGSVGFQIGVNRTDLVLLMMNANGKSKLLGSKFTLGGDASVAAGPVGRTARAQTDLQLTAEILSYSRSRGVFAGVSLEGATLRSDTKEDTDMYGKRVDPREILDGNIPAPKEVQPLLDTLTKYSSQEHR